MHGRILVLAAVAGLSMACPSISWAPDGKAGVPAAPDASGLVEQARKAIADLHAVSYHATVEGAGALAGKVPTVSADVSMTKADAGGWKVYTKGSSSGADAGTVPFEVAYD